MHGGRRCGEVPRVGDRNQRFQQIEVQEGDTGGRWSIHGELSENLKDMLKSIRLIEQCPARIFRSKANTTPFTHRERTRHDPY